MKNKLARVDPSDIPELASRMSAEDLSQEGSAAQLVATIRSMIGGNAVSQSAELAYSALLSVMDANSVKYVRDDDGKLWPFVPGDDYWRGPLRLDEQQQVLQARFYPSQEKIEWCSPWEKPKPARKAATSKAKRRK